MKGVTPIMLHRSKTSSHPCSKSLMYFTRISPFPYLSMLHLDSTKKYNSFEDKGGKGEHIDLRIHGYCNQNHPSYPFYGKN